MAGKNSAFDRFPFNVSALRCSSVSVTTIADILSFKRFGLCSLLGYLSQITLWYAWYFSGDAFSQTAATGVSLAGLSQPLGLVDLYVSYGASFPTALYKSFCRFSTCKVSFASVPN